MVSDEDAIKEPESQLDEYHHKLAKALIAVVAVKEAHCRLHLSLSNPPSTIQAKLSSIDARTLILVLPSTGMNARTFFSVAFLIAWFLVVIPATNSNLGLFMLLLGRWSFSSQTCSSESLCEFKTDNWTVCMINQEYLWWGKWFDIK